MTGEHGVFGRIAKGKVRSFCEPSQSCNAAALPEIKLHVPIQQLYDLGCEMDELSEKSDLYLQAINLCEQKCFCYP